MSYKSEHPEKGCSYFITFTCYQWLPLIDATDSYDFIYHRMLKLIVKQNQVIGFVIMPNHIHFTLFIPETGITLKTIIGEEKRMMAYHIIHELKKRNRFDLLLKLSEGVREWEKKRGKLHQVFDYSFEAKQIRSDKFHEQKLIYMHNNPLKGKWKLANTPEEYSHSSTAFYFSGKESRVKITHYKDAGIYEDA